MRKQRAIILAAGKGTRMNSNRPKVLTPLIDRPILAYVIEALQQANVDEIYVVVGHQAEKVMDAFQGIEGLHFVMQQPQLGTGHAVMQADAIAKEEGETLVISGDSPCITPETIRMLFEQAKEAAMVVLSAEFEDPKMYGRIVRNALGEFEAIVEARDCTRKQLEIREINSGIYCFNNRLLFSALHKIGHENAQNEYYLTDVAKILKENDERIEALIVEEPSEILGINDGLDLEKAFVSLQKRINTYWAKQGVQIESFQNVVIGKDVRFGKDVLIQSGCRITGHSFIDDGCQIRFGSLIHNSTIEKEAVIEQATIKNTNIPCGTHVISALREESKI